MFLAESGQVLLLRRGDGGDYPGHWCFPGGRLEDGESTIQAARREAIEECGLLPPGEPVYLTRQISSDAGRADQVDFTTFLQRVREPFIPTLNDEHTAFTWVDVASLAPADAPSPPEALMIHPGVAIAVARLSMNELDVARAIAAGLLTSPQQLGALWLFAIRITGTGQSYRTKNDEHVWRDPAVFLNEEFLARCNGLAVVWMHPAGELDSEEYADRNIGSVMLPFIRGDEVWGVAKIYDADAIGLMLSSQLSTSSGVNIDLSECVRLRTEDGAKVLIEGDPSFVCHVAIAPYGVWDKGGDPVGVQNDELLVERKDAVATEDEDRRDAARRARFDASCPRMDGESDKDWEDRKDAARRVDQARRDEACPRMDGESDDDWRQRQDAADGDKDKDTSRSDSSVPGADAKLDAILGMFTAVRGQLSTIERRMDAVESRGVPAGTTEEQQRAAEEARHLAAENLRRSDSEEQARRNQATDAALAELRATTARMPKSILDEDYEQLAGAQARFDTVYSALGERAPPPLHGEGSRAYRNRLARGIQKHSKVWSAVKLPELADNAFEIAESQIRNDAMTAANSSEGVPEGVMIERVHVDPSTGQRTITFHGNTSFIRQFSRGGSRVKSWKLAQRG